MASRERSRWVKSLIIGSIVCFVILVVLGIWSLTSFELDWEWDFGDLELPFGPPGFFEVVLFTGQYTAYVFEEGLGEDVTRSEIENWYASEAPRPELERVRHSLRLLPGGEPGTEGFPVQGLVISQNIADELSQEYFSEEAGFWRRVSAPGDDPVFTYRGFEEQAIEGEADEVCIELRHEPDLERGKVLLVFELWGKDRDSGAVKRERHRVTLVERSEGDEAWPFFVVVSHVVEPLPPEPG